MFYLLYDNRIIDSQKEDVYVYEFQIHKWLHKNNEHKTCFGLLKNQSENVFDLIEMGDLLKVKQEKNYVLEEYKEPETTNYASYIKDAYPKKFLPFTNQMTKATTLRFGKGKRNNYEKNE